MLWPLSYIRTRHRSRRTSVGAHGIEPQVPGATGLQPAERPSLTAPMCVPLLRAEDAGLEPACACARLWLATRPIAHLWQSSMAESGGVEPLRRAHHVRFRGGLLTTQRRSPGDGWPLIRGRQVDEDELTAEAYRLITPRKLPEVATWRQRDCRTGTRGARTGSAPGALDD